MSIQMMTLVYQSGLGKSQKSVALAYADHADDEGRNIYPSVEYMAWKTGYSERQIQRVTKELLADRILIREGVGQHGTNKFRLSADRLPKRPPFRPETENPYMGGDKMSPPTFTTPKMSSMSPDPSVNLYKEKETNFNWMEIPVDMDLLDDGAELLQQMTSEIAGTCKGHCNPFDERDPMVRAAATLVMHSRTPEQVHSFRDWWKENGHYEGKPAVKSLLDELENCIDEIQIDRSNRPDQETNQAWAEMLEWRGKKRNAVDFTSPVTQNVIGRMGESRFRNMGKHNEKTIEREFKQLFTALRSERNESRITTG